MITIESPFHAASKAVGSVGHKIEILAEVLLQHSTPVHTYVGTVYSHYHVLRDEEGNLYKYRGSSYFPLGNKIRISATVKGYTHGLRAGAVVTVIKAPKAI